MKRELKFFLISVVSFLLVAQGAAAVMMIPANDAADGAPAPEKSPAINENWGLERVDFVHYEKPSDAGSKPKASSCYKLMRYEWKSAPVSYSINPSNPQGLSEGFVTSAIGISAETWDAAISAELFNNSYAIDYTAQYGVQDFQNSVVFGDYPDNNAIAVTTIWYMPAGRQLVEFDMIFNTRYNWGDATLDSSKMDLQNIGAHEMGHASGLADIYSASCSEVTEYGYSAYGETKKRTLEQADIDGLIRMYGP